MTFPIPPRARDPFPGCPYCGRALRCVPHRWFGHSVYECEQCGDFPDFSASQDAAAPAQGSRSEARAQAPAGHARVLLVDDSREHRELYAHALEGVANVTTASRGEHALALAEADPPDVIVLDVMMPGMDGWETCERLKAEPATAVIPIIMLTSLDGVDVPARARQAGAIAVLMKPCPSERLIMTIEAARRSPAAHNDRPPQPAA
jgi:CheY-like chemotaxis protein